MLFGLGVECPPVAERFLAVRRSGGRGSKVREFFKPRHPERSEGRVRVEGGHVLVDAPETDYLRAQVAYNVDADTAKAFAAIRAGLEVLRAQFMVSAAWLAVDPTWTPLHGYPAFDRLVQRR